MMCFDEESPAEVKLLRISKPPNSLKRGDRRPEKLCWCDIGGCDPAGTKFFEGVSREAMNGQPDGAVRDAYGWKSLDLVSKVFESSLGSVHVA